MTIEYRIGGLADIYKVKEMWQSLAIHHKEQSLHFKSLFETITFEKRIKGFDSMKSVFLMIGHRDQVDIAYIIATVDHNQNGEIASLYVDEDYRGQEIGHTLMTTALNWLESYDVKKYSLGVSIGNEKAFAFYAKYGFYPKVTLLERLK